MAKTMALTATYRVVEADWIEARLVELPGVITVGRSVDEARANLADALEEYLASLGDEPPTRSDPSAVTEPFALVIGS